MPSRRTIVTAAAAGALGAVFAGSAPALGAAGPGARRATVTGPIRGGRRGRPFGAYLGDIGALGYVEEEYFISGQATAFRPVGDLGPDGRWTIEPASEAAYKTRILVRRPREAARFNGTVIVEWVNVSAGIDIGFCDTPGVYQGFAYVLVSAQRDGLVGLERPTPQGLTVWDPDRYGELVVPSDAYSYDIFTQAGRVVGPTRRPSGPDPMGGLKVRRLIAAGASQSGGRLTTYANAFQPRERVFDAIVPMINAGSGAGVQDQQDGTTTRQVRFTRIRDDLATPVLVLNSESEAPYYPPQRQPDTPRFVSWEVAGAAHLSTPQLERIKRLVDRDEVTAPWGPPPGSAQRPSDVDWAPTFDAALRHVDRWIAGGSPPPSHPPIATTGARPVITRDAHGNALGGIRLPELEVPVAGYSGPGEGVFLLLGATTPLPPEELKRLYPTQADYVAKVKAAADAALKAGVILPERAKAYADQAAARRFDV